MAEDLRHRYAEALASTNMLDETDLEFTLHLVLGIHEEETAKLREERDLAIAHDRQPYPTAWAYEQACKALNEWRERAETAELVIARAENLRDKWLAWPVGDMHHAAGLMLSKYLDGTAYGADEPRPAALDDTRKETGDGTARGV